ncbi:MAG: magnesium transporter CorA [Clostridia bacterium]|nr:magnesium transporter CorA [Clostridia bacterium]
MTYLIKDTLVRCDPSEIRSGGGQFVAVVTPGEWQESNAFFDMGIDMDLDLNAIGSTRADVNYDSLTGTFLIPDRRDLWGEPFRFAFALDEKGIVFIDAGNASEAITERVRSTKKWKMPSLERFLYDFLEQVIHDDHGLISKYEIELDGIEEKLTGKDGDAKLLERVNDIRGNLRDLRMHYEQLLDLGQELEENENGFFKHDNLRYFHMFTQRVASLRDMASFVRDYTVQLREIYESQLNIKQNHIMTILTVVTAIFMPLTLIAGWYGMNFKYMPELDLPWGYPAVIGVSVAIAVGCIVIFKKKKWL